MLNKIGILNLQGCKEPDRLIIRFFGKNIEKSKKIKHLFNSYNIKLPQWLFDELQIEKIKKLVNIFLQKINNYINNNFDEELYCNCVKLMEHNIKSTYKDPIYKIKKIENYILILKLIVYIIWKLIIIN